MKPSRGSERNDKMAPWKERSSCYVNTVEGGAAENQHIGVEYDSMATLPSSITRIESVAYEKKPKQEEGLFTVVTADGTFPRKLTFNKV
ncbi:hypothetical protein ASPVEDRAFT_151677 [Aspergillus versicolor CBS 583.65]|uniref:Uncharacterized protein n=1 Tax=Aspergillus versicolor CBS 583.65 TaxID=1036611 RepID=A0A1L9PNL0_ASPVE|nr:uncharacterized protein ASPVEDRAFT_151677 [Aspergillus versicolor CBS 583.65]OJJ03114.1 hypothetical protein ASPVEDRAFT_151677 [Aspergillus versicolor CBS 583.65]